MRRIPSGSERSLFGFLRIWSLVHCVTNKRLSDSNRLIGILLIIFLNLLGSLVYLFLPREDSSQLSGPHA